MKQIFQIFIELKLTQKFYSFDLIQSKVKLMVDTNYIDS